mgnify:CR=1 FL=1
MEKTQQPVQVSEFQILFDKLEEAKNQNQNLQVIQAQNEGTLLDKIQEIKRIVEFYSTENNLSTFTRA